MHPAILKKLIALFFFFSLKGALLNNFEIVTTVKKQANHVKKFAKKNNLVIHNWPYSVPLNKFDVGIVVSFGHLIPEDVINSFP